jgi:Mn-dependent DtxR family transcriptional regulator
MRQAMASANPRAEKIDRGATSPSPPWTFLTNHAHVLITIAEDLNVRIRDLASRVGITERAVQKIITDLEDSGYLSHVRDGRRNVYRVSANRPLRHPVEQHRNVAVLLKLAGRPKR